MEKGGFVVSVQGMYYLKTVFSSVTAGKPVAFVVPSSLACVYVNKQTLKSFDVFQ